MNNSGKKTLLWSVIMSSPGPLVVGFGLIIGQTSTQIADFIRRSIELSAIIISFVIYCITSKDNKINADKKRKYEKGSNIFVSIAMIISGIIMTIVALSSSYTDTGNVIPGLSVACLGVIANTVFWLRYKKLGKETSNKILLIQSKLYRAKTFVDISVVIALGAVLFSDNPTVSYYFDIIGTICVSAYLCFSGITSFLREINKTNI